MTLEAWALAARHGRHRRDRGPLYGCTGLCGSRRGRDDDGQVDGLLDAGGCVLLLGTPAGSRDGRVDSVDMGPWPEMAQIFEMNCIISKFRLFARV